MRSKIKIGQCLLTKLEKALTSPNKRNNFIQLNLILLRVSPSNFDTYASEYKIHFNFARVNQIVQPNTTFSVANFIQITQRIQPVDMANYSPPMPGLHDSSSWIRDLTVNYWEPKDGQSFRFIHISSIDSKTKAFP